MGIIGKVLGGIIGVYLLLSLSFLIFHPYVIFQPDSLSRDYLFEFNEAYEEFFIPMPDGVEINALLFRAAENPKGLILYFHGNKDNLQRWGNYAGDFTALGYDVLMSDYRGYGKSSGKPAEQALYQDAKAIYDWAQRTFHYSTVVIYGRSLGTAVASHLAMQVQPELLVLETPFDEIWGVVYPVFLPTVKLIQPRMRFSNAEHLTRVASRTVIIYGTNDWVVPRTSTERLKSLQKPGDEFIVIEDGSHNNLNSFPEYHQTLSRLLH